MCIFKSRAFNAFNALERKRRVKDKNVKRGRKKSKRISISKAFNAFNTLQKKKDRYKMGHKCKCISKSRAFNAFNALERKRKKERLNNSTKNPFAVHFQGV